jgi:HEAT repeat protein
MMGTMAAGLLAQTPAEVAQAQSAADAVERVHREAARIQADVMTKFEIEQAVRAATSAIPAAATRHVMDRVNAQIEAAVAGRHWTGSGSSAYRRGMRSLDERKWDEAIEYFKKTDKYRPDAALYWTAFANFKAGRSPQALTAIATLNSTYGSSAWLNDAKTLEVEIKASQGKPVNPDSVNDEEIRLIAVSGLIRTDVEKGLPYLEKMVLGSSSPRVKEEALSMLARTNSPKARDLVVRIARSGNPDMQLKAIQALGHMDSKENVSTLQSLYGDAKDRDTKEEILDALSHARAARALVDVAKAEKDFELRKRAVRHLSRMNTKESNEFLLEVLK